MRSSAAASRACAMTSLATGTVGTCTTCTHHRPPSRPAMSAAPITMATRGHVNTFRSIPRACGTPGARGRGESEAVDGAAPVHNPTQHGMAGVSENRIRWGELLFLGRTNNERKALRKVAKGDLLWHTHLTWTLQPRRPRPRSADGAAT